MKQVGAATKVRTAGRLTHDPMSNYKVEDGFSFEVHIPTLPSTEDLTIVKKDGTHEKFNLNKTMEAIGKSADRVMVKFTQEDVDKFCNSVIDKALKLAKEHKDNELSVQDMHKIVETSLDQINSSVARSYRDYRNYKTTFVSMLDKVFQEDQRIRYLGDVENSNADSAIVSTKRSLIFNELNKELYKMFFLNVEELQAAKDGYIYIHDMSARRDTTNCCLCDISAILEGGFEMGNQWYTEPKSLDVAFDVIGDIVMYAASQQYGGFTVPQIDQVLKKYADLSYNTYFTNEYNKLTREYNFYAEMSGELKDKATMKKVKERNLKMAKDEALRRVERDFEQGFQGWEYKFNTVASSRGDYPFITMTLGLGTSDLERMASKVMLRVRMNGQGKPGAKRAVLFPKYVMLYDSRIHGEMGVARDVYEAAVKCSSKALYPDWLSLEPGSYVGDMYQKYGTAISPMGCRAFLSPWYERGGMEPADEDDKPVFIGRNNLGVISFNFPMILAKAREEGKDFYEVFDYYFEMARNLHKRTYDYIGELRAGTNPLMFCQGGFYGGHLKPEEKVRPLLKSSTMSFGYTALNELQELYNGKSLVEDGQFAIEVMQYLNKKVDEAKKEDGILYAIYATPAESLCGKQVVQFRKKYGIIKNVSDREYFSNSFHCHVSEDITPTQKQDYEARFWSLSNGGKIQYVRYRSDKNLDSFKILIDRAMKMGFYEGCNMDKGYCEDCGYSGVDFPNEQCPHCHSTNIVTMNRVCGYLGYSKIHGKSRMNDAKMAEVRDRVSM